jgi:[ribosomal protein S5]-alanine N-acetyltransferase
VSPPGTLTTARLRLRRPAAGDAAAIFAAYAQDPEVTRYLTWRPHASVDHTRAFLRRCAEGWRDGTEFSWVLSLREGEQLVGMLALRPEGHRVNLGYVLARPFWGQGLMPEAARAIVDWALTEPDVYRVWAVCDVENTASARVLDKIGMTREGVLRRWILHPNAGDGPRDCLCYARVR